jgi:hypothetical protein
MMRHAIHPNLALEEAVLKGQNKEKNQQCKKKKQTPTEIGIFAVHRFSVCTAGCEHIFQLDRVQQVPHEDPMCDLLERPRFAVELTGFERAVQPRNETLSASPARGQSTIMPSTTATAAGHRSCTFESERHCGRTCAR